MRKEGIAMNRAQEIRQKRLAEQKATAEKKTKHDLEIKSKAETLFDWVLDFFTDITVSQVILDCTFDNKIEFWLPYHVGYKRMLNKPFDHKVMVKLVEMFEAEDGYSAKLIDYSNGYSSVTIKVE